MFSPPPVRVRGRDLAEILSQAYQRLAAEDARRARSVGYRKRTRRVVEEMKTALTKASAVKVLLPVLLLVVICLVALIAVLQNKPSVTAHKPSVAANAADDFNRAPGGLGPDWTNIGDGGLSISSHAVTGRSGLTGDIWTAGTFTSDQYSQIEVTSTQLTGGEWTGTAVRAQHGGRDAYVGIYYWNSGKQELMLFRRSGQSWTHARQLTVPGRSPPEPS